MPRLSAVAVRAALLYLLFGFSFGALLLANKGVPLAGWIWNLLPAHIEFLLVGWTSQLILGVAFWILPRFPGGSRGNEALARWALALLNTGILMVAVQGLLPANNVLLLPGRGLEVMAAILFALHAWKRIRPSGKKI